MQVQDITSFNLYVNVKFTGLVATTVQRHLEHKKDLPHAVRESKCKVDRVVDMELAEYVEFCNDLTKARDWIGDVGGTSSSISYDKPSYQWTDAERARWVAASWHHVVAVTCAEKPTIFVNAQGYDYARYIGLSI